MRRILCLLSVLFAAKANAATNDYFDHQFIGYTENSLKYQQHDKSDTLHFRHLSFQRTRFHARGFREFHMDGISNMLILGLIYRVQNSMKDDTRETTSAQRELRQYAHDMSLLESSRGITTDLGKAGVAGFGLLSSLGVMGHSREYYRNSHYGVGMQAHHSINLFDLMRNHLVASYQALFVFYDRENSFIDGYRWQLEDRIGVILTKTVELSIITGVRTSEADFNHYAKSIRLKNAFLRVGFSMEV